MRVVAFDTETFLIEPGILAPRLVCMSVAQKIGNNIRTDLYGARDVGQVMTGYLLDNGVRIVGHNVAYDLAVIAQAYPELLPLIFAAYDADRVGCTMVREKLINIAGEGPPKFSLADLSQRYLDRALEKGEDTWRLRYSELVDVPVSAWPDAARTYAALDALTTIDVWEAQPEMPDTYPQIRAHWALHLCGVHGIRTDPAMVEVVAERILKKEAEDTAKLQALGLKRADGSKDMKVIAELVTKAYDGDPPLTPTGKVSAGNETLLDSGDEVLIMLAETGEASKLSSSFVPVIKRGTKVPITPRWNVLVNTGRTSCGDPNLQQLPKANGIRECFIPSKGMVFFGADYSTLELRTLAQVLEWEFGDNAMARALRSGMDLHVKLAAEILGMEYDPAYKLYKAGDQTLADTRQTAKIGNFGLPGGLSPKTFVRYAKAQGCIISEPQATAIKESWFRAWPEMRDYFDARSQETQGGDCTVVQPFSGRIRARVNYCAALNTRFQGLAADGAKRALVAVAREQYTDPSSPLYGTRTVAFIHDELLCEGPEDTAPEAAERLSYLMVREMQVVCPDIPIVAEPDISRRWSKKTKQVRDKAGRLMVCE